MFLKRVKKNEKIKRKMRKKRENFLMKKFQGFLKKIKKKTVQQKKEELTKMSKTFL